MSERVFDDNDRCFVEEFSGDLVSILELIFGNGAFGWLGIGLDFFSDWILFSLPRYFL
jgi:hypothetical protein